MYTPSLNYAQGKRNGSFAALIAMAEADQFLRNRVEILTTETIRDNAGKLAFKIGTVANEYDPGCAARLYLAWNRYAKGEKRGIDHMLDLATR